MPTISMGWAIFMSHRRWPVAKIASGGEAGAICGFRIELRAVVGGLEQSSELIRSTRATDCDWAAEQPLAWGRTG